MSSARRQSSCARASSKLELSAVQVPGVFGEEDLPDVGARCNCCCVANVCAVDENIIAPSSWYGSQVAASKSAAPSSHSRSEDAGSCRPCTSVYLFFPLMPKP